MLLSFVGGAFIYLIFNLDTQFRIGALLVFLAFNVFSFLFVVMIVEQKHTKLRDLIKNTETNEVALKDVGTQIPNVRAGIANKLSVFISYSSSDKDIIRNLHKKLLTEGWIDPWLDEEKLYPGQEWDLEIEKAVKAAHVVVVCLSNNSVSKEGYIQKEIRFVLNIAEEKPEGSIFIIPLRLNECIVPTRLRTWQYVDYFPANRREWAYKRLLESLKIRAQSTK